jgi:hypothetical protein
VRNCTAKRQTAAEDDAGDLSLRTALSVHEHQAAEDIATSAATGERSVNEFQFAARLGGLRSRVPEGHDAPAISVQRRTMNRREV